MGFQEAAQKANEAWTAKLGIAAVYVPSPDSGAPSFPCTVIPGRVEVDELDERGETDQQPCSMLHSSLVAGGLTAPTVKAGNVAGDQIVIPNLNGIGESWTIADADHDGIGMWKLMLKRNRRVVP